MRIHVILLGIVAGAAVALTPTHLLAQQAHRQMQDLTERERLEQMQEHVVEGMRRMAARIDAIQKRIAAIDRGEPDAAPMPEGMGMGMGQGHGMGQGQGMGMGQAHGMRARGGSGPACPNMSSPEHADAPEHEHGADI